jgi:hypothetical protein
VVCCCLALVFKPEACGDFAERHDVCLAGIMIFGVKMMSWIEYGRCKEKRERMPFYN